MFIFDLLLFILVLGIIILIHEAGHFYFAKRAGILCHEFSIGMGPALYQKRKGETIYSVRGIPIGGYVSMAGESINDALIRKEQVIGINLNNQGQIVHLILNSELKSDLVGIVKEYDLYGKDFNQLFITLEVEGVSTTYPVVRDAIYKISDKRELWITPSEKSFESKTLWQRFLVIFAGPFMNFILAFLLFFIIGFFVMKPNLDSSELGMVASQYPAGLNGVQNGDVITEINGISITGWSDVSLAMSSVNSASLSLSYTREGVLYTIEDVKVVVAIQTAGITNLTKELNIYNDEPIIGRAFGRALKGDELREGDRIQQIQVGNITYPITNWDDIIDVFMIHRSGEITVEYLRDTEVRTKTYSLISETALVKLGASAISFQLGIAPTSSFDLLYSLGYPFKAFYGNMSDVFVTIGLLFDPNEQLGIRDLSGPIGIFSLVSQTAAQGLLSILGFTAFLSINIGMLNLLPIPALDGGRLIFLGIEAVTRKPLNRRFENTVNNIMFFLLLALFIFVAFNDIFG